MARAEKWIEKRKLSERSEFFRFPFFSAWQREPRRGWNGWGELFAYFLAGQKVSGCRAAPGAPFWPKKEKIKSPTWATKPDYPVEPNYSE